MPSFHAEDHMQGTKMIFYVYIFYASRSLTCNARCAAGWKLVHDLLDWIAFEFCLQNLYIIINMSLCFFANLVLKL